MRRDRLNPPVLMVWYLPPEPRIVQTRPLTVLLHMVRRLVRRRVRLRVRRRVRRRVLRRAILFTHIIKNVA